MPNPSKTLIDLEKKFWQAIVDHDTDGALELLSEPALMVSTHGAMKFDHDGYRKMAPSSSAICRWCFLTTRPPCSAIT